MRKINGNAWVWIIVILGAIGLTVLAVMDTLKKKERNDTMRRAQYVNLLLGEIQVNKMLCRMIIQEKGDKDDTFAINIKSLKEFMIMSDELFTTSQQTSERLLELKKRMLVLGMLTADGFQTYINPKDAPDVMDIYINLEWLLNKSVANKYNLNF